MLSRGLRKAVMRAGFDLDLCDNNVRLQTGCGFLHSPNDRIVNGAVVAPRVLPSPPLCYATRGQGSGETEHPINRMRSLRGTDRAPAMSNETQSRRRSLWRVARLLAVGLVLVLLLPYLLVPLYRVVDPVSTLMVWRWVRGAPVTRTVVRLDRIAPALPATVIASEDARFCTHPGVDWQEIRDAIEDADDLSEARGGSTITQQTAKNLFLWGGRSYVRKALELPLAIWIDLVLPKRRVLEIYLNIVEWGPGGQFGAEAGARFAFGKSARELTPREAATLAAILPNPHRRSAKVPGPAVRRLAAIYEARGRGANVACLRPRS
jgi:monofunctional biosynthetic peptidoglycan transglycosylase